MTSSPSIRIGSVAYDAAARRYLGDVIVTRRDRRPQHLELSVPGHPRWGHRRIAAALAAAGRKRPELRR